MTKLTLMLGVFVAIAASSSMTRPAAAIEYPWCVSYSDMDGGGGKNCGFISYDQCMLTARGAGGSCDPNQFYTEPRPQRPQRQRRRHD
jgi:uncharacterized protein DUF3551